MLMLLLYCAGKSATHQSRVQCLELLLERNVLFQWFFTSSEGSGHMQPWFALCSGCV